jgi:hypothetical protein
MLLAETIFSIGCARTHIHLDLLALILYVLDLLLEPLAAPDQCHVPRTPGAKFISHLLLYKFQASIHSHDCLRFVLLQQHRPDLLVDIRFVIEKVEFLCAALASFLSPVSHSSHLLHGRVLLLLALQFLPRLHGRGKL